MDPQLIKLLEQDPEPRPPVNFIPTIHHVVSHKQFQAVATQHQRLSQQPKEQQ